MRHLLDCGCAQPACCATIGCSQWLGPRLRRVLLLLWLLLQQGRTRLVLAVLGLCWGVTHPAARVAKALLLQGRLLLGNVGLLPALRQAVRQPWRGRRRLRAEDGLLRPGSGHGQAHPLAQ